MQPNTLFSEQVAILHAAVTPGDSDTYSTEWVDMSRNSCALFMVTVGNVAANLNAKLEQCVTPDDSPTSVKDITGKAVAQLTSSTDDKCKAIELRAEELDKVNSYRYARLTVTSVDSPPGVDALALHAFGIFLHNNAVHADNVTEIDT